VGCWMAPQDEGEAATTSAAATPNMATRDGRAMPLLLILM